MYQRCIHYYETDKMGIVHHSNYIRYFEEARLDWMETRELSYQKIEEMGLIIPVMFVECQYKLPLHFHDAVEIDVELIKYDGIKMEFSYSIYRKDTGELCTTGRTGHCFLNSDMKPVNMKRKYPELYQMLKAAVRKAE